MKTTHRITAASALALLALAAPGCRRDNNNPDPPECDATVQATGLPCEDPDVVTALDLLHSMTLEEKVQQMSGLVYNSNNMFDQGDNERLGIPGFRFMDGPRGVRWMNGNVGTTVYPVPEARASTWNVELERRIGKGMADEMRYLGRHVLLAPTINQVMHPRWGRAQETYGEDSFLLGAFGAAFVRGAQYDPTVADPADPDQPVDPAAYRIQACAKHLAANNIEDTRIRVNAVLDERTLREVYLPHFKKAVDAGVSCVMASYNRVNGVFSGYSSALTREILKTDWGYSGWVVSDWFAHMNTQISPVAGTDIEMPFSEGECPGPFECEYSYGSRLVNAVAQGQVDVKWLDEAVLRILYRKVAFHVLDRWDATEDWFPELTRGDSTRALTQVAAEQGMVLLKNGPSATSLADDVLPLDSAVDTKIATVGFWASIENLGDHGSSDAKVMNGTMVFTPYEGIKEYLGATNTSRTSCGVADPCALTFSEVAGNEATLGTMDAVVVVTGYYFADLARLAGEEGEWKDRESLNVSQAPGRDDLANLNAAIALKQTYPALKVIVHLKGGGAIIVKPWVDSVDALIMGWYGGMNEGRALARILFGDVNPSGKLVQTFPVAEADLPAFDNTNNGDVVYSYYHGYRYFDRENKTPQYLFGYGLHYTTFEYSNLHVAATPITEAETLTVSVDVKNTGTRTGSEVVQLYVGFDATAVDDQWGRPKKELKGFARVEDLAPDETRTVTIEVDPADLAYWDTAAQAMKVETMQYQLYVGPSSNLADALTGTFTIH